MSSGNVYEIKTPYVVYCGDQTSKTSLKVACGVIEWVPEKVVAVTNDSYRLFPDMQNVSLDEAVKLGAATLVIGFAPFGGKLTDAIVDIVETGSTLKANGLEVIEWVTEISARLIANTASLKLRKAEIEELQKKLEAVTK